MLHSNGDGWIVVDQVPPGWGGTGWWNETWLDELPPPKESDLLPPLPEPGPVTIVGVAP